MLAVILVWRLAPEWLSPAVRPDPEAPWRIELGRGSGLEGLNTVAVSSDGAVVLHRLNHASRVTTPFWETAAMRLPPDALAEVLDSVARNRLLNMGERYRPWPAVDDGTQWVFRFRQGEREKSVSFDNEFPGRIRRFAADVDRVLSAHGLGQAVWQRVPDVEARRHERELWDSINRKR